MGRKALISNEAILHTLIDFEILQSDGKLKGRTNRVWSDIASALNNVKNASTFFFDLSQDRNSLFTLYKRIKGVELVPMDSADNELASCDNQVVEITSESEDSTDYPSPKRKKVINNNKNNYIEFSISIPKIEWNNIEPIEKMYEDSSKKMVLQEGWTDCIRKHIYLTEVLPCSFSFIRHEVDSIEGYIHIVGKCNECHSSLTVFCLDKPSILAPQDSVIFQVKTINSVFIPHKSKARLQKGARNIVKKELINMKPKSWRRKNALIFMNPGSCEPPFLYSSTQLQKARQDAITEDLGITKGLELVDSIEKLKENPEFDKFIGDIGKDKFSVQFWSPEQVSINNDIIAKLKNPTSLDATSSIVAKVPRPNGESSAIFLTVLLTHIEDMIVPLTQVNKWT